MAAEPVPRSIIVPSTEPLMAVLEEEDGREIVRYFVGDMPAASTMMRDPVADALSLAGAWSDLDWDDMAHELDRIRHESRPTPPIEL